MIIKKTLFSKSIEFSRSDFDDLFSVERSSFELCRLKRDIFIDFLTKINF